MTFYLAALPMLALSVAADPTPYVSVVSHQDKDCAGNALVATYDSSGGASSTSHCFATAGRSFQYLKSLDTTCARGFLSAFASDDCSDPDGAFLLQEYTGGDSQACKNVVEGYGSFQLGCVF
jgi:hypothetical protein